MVNHICMGNHPTFGMGLYVAHPTIDVLLANKFQMAWSTLFEQFQVVATGNVVVADDGSYSSSFSWTNLGYNPIIFISNNKYPLQLEYVSTSSARLRRAPPTAGTGSNPPGSDIPSGDVTAYFIVTRSVKP